MALGRAWKERLWLSLLFFYPGESMAIIWDFNGGPWDGTNRRSDAGLKYAQRIVDEWFVKTNGGDKGEKILITTLRPSHLCHTYEVVDTMYKGVDQWIAVVFRESSEPSIWNEKNKWVAFYVSVEELDEVAQYLPHELPRFCSNSIVIEVFPPRAAGRESGRAGGRSRTFSKINFVIGYLLTPVGKPSKAISTSSLYATFILPHPCRDLDSLLEHTGRIAGGLPIKGGPPAVFFRPNPFQCSKSLSRTAIRHST